MKKHVLILTACMACLNFTACSANTTNQNVETSVTISEYDPLTPLKELISEVEAHGDEYNQEQWQDINKLYQLTLAEIPSQKLSIEQVNELQKLNVQYIHLIKEKQYKRN